MIRKRRSKRVTGARAVGVVSGCVNSQFGGSASAWMIRNCDMCRRSASWGIDHGVVSDCGVDVAIESEMSGRGFPGEASMRYVLGRSIEQGLRMGDTWPKVCAHFEGGES